MQLDWNADFGFDPMVGPVPGHVLSAAFHKYV